VRFRLGLDTVNSEMGQEWAWAKSAESGLMPDPHKYFLEDESLGDLERHGKRAKLPKWTW
jgi:hypothetical protein